MKMMRWAKMLAVCVAVAAILRAATPASMQADAGQITFNFALDGSYKTSAGAYKTDGTLVRTLWNNRAHSAGTHQAVWDGKDDYGTDVPAGTYEIHLIRHNVTYTWEGVLGNSSNDKTGNRVHRIYTGVTSMAIAGTKAFYTDAYAEGFPGLLYFDTTDPQVMYFLSGNRAAGVNPYV
ncbi:MAG TPA: FlgD immunoglobulin-like domain containing protein, partial [Planctomycetota bacterium]|nr:FlgD immunoglobulin-like domain containing protein [Planctomycetota bacterium]